MHTISAGHQTLLDGEAATLAYCWKISRTDGVQYFYTSHDGDLTVDGDTYLTGASFSPGDVVNSDDISRVDEFELLGILETGQIEAAIVRDGWLDGATVEVFLVDYTDPASGFILTLRKGYIGEIRNLDNNRYFAEVSGLSQKLQTHTGQLYAPHCRADLGDARCKINLKPTVWVATTAYTVRQARDAGIGDTVKPSVETTFWFKCTVAGTSDAVEPTWPVVLGGTVVDGSVTWEAVAALARTGTVTSVADNANFADTSRGEADDHWNTGTVEWLTGANAGLKMEVRDFVNATGDIKLFLNMRGAIVVSDTYEIFVGCAKDVPACRDTFDNIWNMRAEPLLPGNDAIVRRNDDTT